MKLNIEMIPKNCWGKNLRSKLKPQNSWDKIRKEVYAKEKMCCHICGEKKDILEAHEVWEFDEINHIQKLVDIIGICKSCHNTIHFGLAQLRGLQKEAIEQFIKVNECSMLDFKGELMIASINFERRSKITDWKLDLSLIEKQGYVVVED